jgi:hypothetical protein
MSPEGIKDALSAFQGAREIADPDRSSEDLSNVDGRHTDSSARGKPENGTA